MRYTKLSALFILGFLFIQATAFSQTIIYVDSSAQGLNNGMSWANAFTSLDSAFLRNDLLTDNDSVFVAKGTYKPSQLPRGSVVSNDNRDFTFHFPTYCPVLGGFPSGGGMRDPKRNRTVLSGDINVAGVQGDNVYHVALFQTGDTYVDGFTIMQGMAIGQGNLLINGVPISRSAGAGIVIEDVDRVMLANMIVERDTALAAAGILSKRSMVILVNSFISGNFGLDYGGGIANDTLGILDIRNSVLVKNESLKGGGVFNRGKLLIKHTTFAANHGPEGGGAIFNSYAQECSISNSLFSLNKMSSLTDGDWEGDDIYEQTNGTPVTTIFFSSLQAAPGLGGCVYAADAQLANMDDPDGADNIFGTFDDGLVPTPQSSAFNTGNSGSIDEDIAGMPRNIAGFFEMGAYEIDPCSRLTSRTVYIDSAQNLGNSGNSWNDALNNLQAGINLALMGCIDTIKVAKGTYFPIVGPRDWEPEQNRVRTSYKTFHLPGNIVLLGGYAPGGTTRDPAIYPSVIHRSQIGFANNPLVLVLDANKVVFDGFSVTGGSANEPIIPTKIKGKNYKSNVGAGMLISGSVIDVRNSFFFNNNAAGFGGGVYAENSIVRIDSSKFENNKAYSFYEASGGGVYFAGSGIGSSIRHSSFKNNTAEYYGGGAGLFQCYNNVIIDSCQFTKNVSLSPAGNVAGGGGVSAREGTRMHVLNSVFIENKGLLGGGINLSHNTISYINRCFFLRDTAYREGGGLSIRGVTDTQVGNSVFVANVASEGGAIEVQDAATILACTFTENKATIAGGAINVAASFNLVGSVFWKNKLNDSETVPGADMIYSAPANAAINSFQNNTGTFFGTNMQGLDPLFLDLTNPLGADNKFGTADDGLQLTFGSPLLNEAWYGQYPSIFLASDAKGDPRMNAGLADLGAYELDFCNLSAFTNKTVYVDSSVQGGNRSGNSWTNAFRTIEEALKVSKLSCGIDTIKVAKGTYLPTVAPGYNVYTSVLLPYQRIFTLRDTLHLLGGYPTGGGERSIAVNPTILTSPYSLEVFKMQDLNIPVVDGFTFHQRGFTASRASFVFRNNVFREVLGNPWPILIENSWGDMVNCVFEKFDAPDFGAIREVNSTMRFSNCVFSKNVTRGLPASCLQTVNSTTSLYNCTFFGNRVNFGTVLALDPPSKLDCFNSVFWDNRDNYQYSDPSKHVINFDGLNMNNIRIVSSLFENAPNATLDPSNRFGVYPEFADSSLVTGADNLWGTSDDGLYLTTASPALNSGDNTFVPTDALTDITHTKRICGNIVDRGAYEFDCLLGGRFANKLVALGAVETAVDTLQGCGTQQYFESQVTNDRYIAYINGNGNIVNYSSLTVDASATFPHFRINGTDTTALANRMLSIIAPGNYTMNNGVTVRFYYDSTEFANLPKYSREWFKHPAHTKAGVLADLDLNGLKNAVLWKDIIYGTENGIAFVEFKNIKGFSTFGLVATNVGQALPVDFISFSARRIKEERRAQLDWTTADEINNDRFVIERSANGASWEEIGSVKGKGTYGGETTYQFIDNQPDLPRSYYRIRQVDISGHKTYTEIRQVSFDDTGNNRFVIGPNPASTFVAIHFTKEQPLVNIELIDLSGRQLLHLNYKNTNQIRLEVEKIKSGIYILKVNGVLSKLIIQK